VVQNVQENTTTTTVETPAPTTNKPLVIASIAIFAIFMLALGAAILR
jgi:hypothetical protein